MRSASVIARTPRSSTREPGLARRLVSGVFGTNAGVLITVPGMVLVMGAVFVVMGQQSLQTSIDASLRARMADLTTAASHSAAFE